MFLSLIFPVMILVLSSDQELNWVVKFGWGLKKCVFGKASASTNLSSHVKKFYFTQFAS